MTRLRRILALLALPALAAGVTAALPVAASAAGQTYTWTNHGQSNSWSDAGNWSPSGVPGNGDSVVLEATDQNSCTAHVADVPRVSLANLTLHDTFDGCLASIDSGGPITVTRSLTWTSAIVSVPLTLAAGATGTISGDPKLAIAASIDAPMTVKGRLTLRGNTGDRALLLGGDHGSLTVAPGGTLASPTGRNLITGDCCVNPRQLINHGTISVGGGTFRVADVELDQDATVAFAHGGTLVAGDAPITSTGGRYTGAGTFRISENSGNPAELTGTQNLGPNATFLLRTSSAEHYLDVGGRFALAGTGTFEWDNGTLEAGVTIGHGVHVVVPKTVGSNSGNSRRVLAGRDRSVTPRGNAVSVVNHGTISLGAGARFGTADVVRLTNAADGHVVFAPGSSVVAATCCDNPDRITNAGSVVVPGGRPARPVTLDGVRYLQTGGTTVLQRGAVFAVTPIAFGLDGGTLSGLGTLRGALANTGGTVSPGGSGNAGRLTVSGRYTQGKGGVLTVDLAARSHDLLSVTGAVTLGGRLAAHNLGAYRPSGTARPAVVTGHPLHGSTGCVTTTGSGSTGKGARHWTASVSGGALVLHSVAGARTHC